MPFNFFKKKIESKEPKKAESAPRQVSPKGTRVSLGGMSGKILLKPHISEKASLLAEKNQYVFRVSSSATKFAVKNALKEAFGVDATKVNLVTIPAKTRRRGKTLGVKPGYTKAIVRLKKGQVIEMVSR